MSTNLTPLKATIASFAHTTEEIKTGLGASFEGRLHQDASVRDFLERNLAVYQPGQTDKESNMPGIKFQRETSKKTNREISNNFAMAALSNEDGLIASGPTRAQQHHTGTFPFITRDILITDSLFGLPEIVLPARPKVHLYCYDLESFFYILIWAASRYDLNASAPVPLPAGSPLLEWSSRGSALKAKGALYTGLGIKSLSARPEWQGLWKEWTVPLSEMFADGFVDSDRALRRDDDDFDHVTCGGLTTFEKFMQVINLIPRHANPDSQK